MDKLMELMRQEWKHGQRALEGVIWRELSLASANDEGGKQQSSVSEQEHKAIFLVISSHRKWQETVKAEIVGDVARAVTE